jgi:uncharacterized damage-inducible protein DinB
MLSPSIREWQIDQLHKAVQVVGAIVAQTAPADTTTYRDGGTGWTVQEVIGHLLDFETIFLQRARLTVEQNDPDLPAPDPDELVTQGNYNDRPLRTIFDGWVAQRRALVAYYAGRQAADWDRTATHPRRGRISLDEQLLLIVRHDLNHIEQMMHILADRRR